MTVMVDAFLPEHLQLSCLDFKWNSRSLLYRPFIAIGSKDMRSGASLGC